MKRVTVEISTKNRYDLLFATLLSIALQTFKDFDVLIFDDNEEPKDLRALPQYGIVFELFNQYKIGWKVIYGRKLGQHHNHQLAQEIAKTEWMYRIDDDEVAEPDVLEKLLSRSADTVGAVAGLVLPPKPLPLPVDAANVISDLNRPNIQWFPQYNQVIEVDHLHSSFLYRRGIAKYELSLSKAAHREETLFTYELKRSGYKLLVDTSAVTWHFRGAGGIRSFSDPKLWENDERIFQSKLLEWGVNCEPTKVCVLDLGRGDHVVFKSLIPKLKEKYGKVIVATCYPDILNGEVEQISIAEASQRYGNLDRFNLYRWCIDHNWKREIAGAFQGMYGIS